MADPGAHRAIEAVWRIESARLIAHLARMVRDVGLAEELAQDALVAALERWPESGIPESPGAWLMATAKHRAIDLLRRGKQLERKHEELGRELEAARELAAAGPEGAPDDGVGDDLLRLVLVACHPVLPTDARVALTLRLLGGLTTEEIARAFLVPAPTIAQRIVRAKRTLGEARVPFEVPRGAELAARLSSVLEVIYLVFNEGYAATAGDDWMRPALCEDALRLGRILAGLVPEEPEVHGLVALLELQASRTRARLGPSGEPILLLDQNRARWDGVLIRRGLAALARAEALGGAEGPYALQAAIAACHARARTAGETDWARIAALYGTLARRAPSPVVELNRAVAVGMASGPAAGLAHVDALAAEPALRSYHLLPSVRGDLLSKLGRLDEARAELERAASLTRNERERDLLLRRAAECGRREPIPGSTQPLPGGTPGASSTTGDRMANPIPQGMHTLTPNLVLRDCAKAIEFYKKALGAQEVMRMPAPDGKSIWHAELRIGDSMFFLNDEMPGMGRSAPTAAEPVPVTMWLYVPDCDAAFRRAVDAGAKATMPPADMFWGDRCSGVADPYGYLWSFATHQKDLTQEEMRRAGEEFARSMQQHPPA